MIYTGPPGPPPPSQYPPFTNGGVRVITIDGVTPHAGENFFGMRFELTAMGGEIVALGIYANELPLNLQTNAHGVLLSVIKDSGVVRFDDWPEQAVSLSTLTPE